MSTDQYRITFEGKLLDGFERAEVQSNLQTLFGISEAQASSLFSSSVTSLKSGLTLEAANRYRDRLAEAGADVKVVSMNPGAAPAEPATPPEATSFDQPRSSVNTAPADSVAAVEPPPTATTAPDQAAAEPREARLEFTGNGREYFGIWIVNILLTIATLGVYSAWATVRDKQYFYGNTRLDGASFQYLANPLTILKGRVIALVALIAYVAIVQMFPKWGMLLPLLLLGAVPWIVVRSLRFNALMSAYRNVRFDFQGSYGQAAKVTILWPILAVFTLYLLAPYVLLKSHRFIANGSRYGTSSFKLNNTSKPYYILFGVGLLIIIGFGLATFLAHSMGAESLGMLVAAAGYLAVVAYFLAGITNLFLNGVSLENHQMISRLKVSDIAWLYFSNGVLIMLTLGLFIPWARVRMAKYRAERTAMLVHGDLNNFAAAAGQRTSAVGQELGDAFDIGFSAI